MIRKTAIATAVVLAIALAGCEEGPSVSQQLAEIEKAEASAIAFTAMNTDKDRASQFLTELKKRDPSVKEVFFTLDQGGRKTMSVSRDAPNGEVEVWEMPADMFASMEKETEVAKLASGSNPGGFNANAFMMGYLLSNALSPTSSGFAPRVGSMSRFSSPSNYSSFRGISQSQYNANQFSSAMTQAKANSVSTGRAASYSSGGSRSAFSGGSRGASASSSGG